MANNKKKAKAAAAESGLDSEPITGYPNRHARTIPRPRSLPKATPRSSPRPTTPTVPAGHSSLRFDPTGRADELPELLAKATKQKLTGAEAWALAEALRAHEPWLEWTGKREAKSFAVDPVALH